VVGNPTFFDVVLFQFTDSEYYGNGVGIAVNESDGNTFAITVINEYVYNQRNLINGETYNFSITYNATN